jgi:formylglycine-generating enzyme required for sulfatase activity
MSICLSRKFAPLTDDLPRPLGSVLRSVLLLLLPLSLSGGAVVAQAADKTFTNSLGMYFVLIPAGTFMMGAGENEPVSGGERPRHRVTISKPFYLGRYEVTQEQWEAVMGENPSEFQGWFKGLFTRRHPVERVAWCDAQKFIERLNRKEGHTRYRLPTEAEWEYAAKAGSDYPYGDAAGRLKRYAWYDDNSGETTHPVGQKQPNAWGLHDMLGNVGEWVQDLYSDRYYSHSPDTDPQGPAAGYFFLDRVHRGGCWASGAWNCRPASRFGSSPGFRVVWFGFRLALSLDQ